MVRSRAAPSVVGMDTALITGASRGLGLALARELARRSWRLVIDARGAEALEAARAELAALTEVVAIPGDVADAEHLRALVPGRRPAHRPARQQRQRARPEPAAARSPTTRSTCSSASTASTCSRRWRCSSSPCRRSAPGACVLNVTSDAAVEAYEGWGGYGSSKAALEQLSRILGAEHPGAADRRRRPRRHEHADAPGGVPGRGHLRPPAARGRACPACSRSSYGDAPSGRYQASAVSARMSAALAFELPRRLEADRAAARARRGADAGRLARAASRHASFLDLPDLLEPGDLLVVNTSATLPAALPAERSGGDVLRLHLSTPLPGSWPDDGYERWVVELRDGAAPYRGGRAGERLRAAGRRPGRAAGAVPRAAARLWAARLQLPEPLLAYLDRHGEPIRYRHLRRAAAARRLPDDLRVRARQRRDAERRPAVQRARALRARAIAGSRWRRSSSTPACRRSSAARRRIPSASACRPPRPPRSTRAKRVIAVGTTVVRALETRGRRRRDRGRGSRLDAAGDRARGAACAWSTASSPAGTSRTPATC